MQSISVSEFKARCLKLFGEVKSTGRSLLITKNGEPIAVVSPPPPHVVDQSAYGAMADQTRVVGDIVAPFAADDWEALSE